MSVIFHLALASDWAAALDSGSYTTSTRGRSLAQEGFIHASRADQWPAIREAFYADATEPLVLLQIDTDRLDVPVVDEEAEPGSGVTFPHIYGPLRTDAVVRAHELPSPAAAATPAPAYPAPASPAVPGPVPTTSPPDAHSARPSPASFTSVYFTEMFFNALLILLVLACGFAAIALGVAVGGRATPGITGLVGTILGVAIAAWLYRRRGDRGR